MPAGQRGAAGGWGLAAAPRAARLQELHSCTAGRRATGGSGPCRRSCGSASSPSPPPHPRAQGTGKWTIQQAAELSVAAPTMEAALDARFLSGLKEERQAAEAFFAGQGLAAPGERQHAVHAARVGAGWGSGLWGVRSAMKVGGVCGAGAAGERVRGGQQGCLVGARIWQ